MEHDLVGGDPHLKRMQGGIEYCMCFGSCCVTPAMECVCEACDCDTKGSTVISIRETPAPKPITTIPLTNGHFCEDCGTEVFRNGNRGRFPKKCPSCKAA